MRLQVHFFGSTDHRFIDSSIPSFSSDKAKWANWARTVWKFQSTRLSPSSTGFYQFLMTSKYSKNSRIPVTRTLRGNEKQFELARVRVIGIDWKIQYAMLEIDIYWFSHYFSVWWSTNLIILSERVRHFSDKLPLIVISVNFNVFRPFTTRRANGMASECS